MRDRSGGVVAPERLAWDRVESELAARGWKIEAGQMWVLRAQRGTDAEMVTGQTRQEAFLRLAELLLMDEAPHLP
jgi:hypothetical protein